MDGIVLNVGAQGGSFNPALIAQEPGASPSMLMSQKAITDLVRGLTAMDIIYDGTQTVGGLLKSLEDIADRSREITVVPQQYGTVVYTGEEQEFEFTGLDTMVMTFQGPRRGTEAGIYPHVATPKNGFYWADTGTSEPRNVDCVIEPAIVPDISQKGKVTFNGGAQSPTWDGMTSYVSLSGTLSATNAGTHSVTAITDANHAFADGSHSKTVKWVIERATVSLPTQKDDLTYTGNEQTVTWSSTAGLTFSGTQKAINAGTYKPTATPDANHCWADGTIDAKTLSWTIAKAAGSLSINKTSVTLTVAQTTATIAVTRAGNGAITAESNNTTAATVEVSGTNVVVTGKAQGTATITVKVAAGDNHTAPANKTCTVTVTIPAVGTDTKTLTAAQWKAIIDAGADTVAKYLKVGDLTPLIPLNGTACGETFTNYKVRHRIVHIANGHPILELAQNEAGQEIALVNSSKYNTYIDANGTGFCMNRKGQVGNTIDDTLTSYAKQYGPNKGGWDKCYGRGTGMAQLLALYPKEWRDIMRVSTIWTDNTCNQSDVASNITSTQDTLYIACEMNVYGSCSQGNSAMNTKEVQWDWYKAGNSKIANRHDQPTTACWRFLRDGYRGHTGAFVVVYTNGGVTTADAAISSGWRPVFSI